VNLYDFFSRPQLQLPLKRETEDIQAFVESTLDQYLHLLPQLDCPSDLCREIRAQQKSIITFCEGLKTVFSWALKGLSCDAYQKFVEILPIVLPFLDRLTVALQKPDQLGILYRVRQQVTPPLTREGLFHVPFESRHKVAMQRYSVPGLPCLYLGGSLYTCWCEMGRPPLHELQVAAFWLREDKQIKVVNFANRPKRLLSLLTPSGDLVDSEKLVDPAGTGPMLVAHVILWPLIALCSIVAKHRRGAFKAEYILPQFLLQWVAKQKTYDAICYFSTHVPAVTLPATVPVCNFVFASRDIKAKGRCSYLRALFKMTEPASWQLLRAIQVGPPLPRFIPQFDFEFVEGVTEGYGSTEFGKVESRLNQLAERIRLKIKQGDMFAGDVAE